MLKTKAVFERKVTESNPKDCVIEKVITLSNEDYDFFTNNLLKDYNFIIENKGLMRFSGNGTCHCLLVTGEERQDGILVQSEGTDTHATRHLSPMLLIFY